MTAVVAVCEGAADTLASFQWSESQKVGDKLGEWPVGAEEGLRLVPLADDGSLSRADQLGIGESEGAYLDAYSSTRWGSFGLVITEAELQDLREGQVWWRPASKPERIPMATFETAACDWVKS